MGGLLSTEVPPSSVSHAVKTEVCPWGKHQEHSVTSNQRSPYQWSPANILPHAEEVYMHIWEHAKRNSRDANKSTGNEKQTSKQETLRQPRGPRRLLVDITHLSPLSVMSGN